MYYDILNSDTCRQNLYGLPGQFSPESNEYHTSLHGIADFMIKKMDKLNCFVYDNFLTWKPKMMKRFQLISICHCYLLNWYDELTELSKPPSEATHLFFSHFITAIHITICLDNVNDCLLEDVKQKGSIILTLLYWAKQVKRSQYFALQLDLTESSECFVGRDLGLL